jgi:hypothetical protein
LKGVSKELTWRLIAIDCVSRDQWKLEQSFNQAIDTISCRATREVMISVIDDEEELWLSVGKRTGFRQSNF